MTGPIRPVDPLAPRGPQRRTGDRRRGDERRDGEPRPPRALVPAAPEATSGADSHDERPAREPSPAPARPLGPPASFAAQVLGQDGARKGLKGGPPVLNAARSTYLGAEYSGERDRRPQPGKGKRTDV